METQQAEILERDRFAEEYDQWYLQKGYSFVFTERTTINLLLNLRKEDIIIDAGCGTGDITFKLAKKCKKVYAIDFSPKSLEVLEKKMKRENVSNIVLIKGDIAEKSAFEQIKEKVDKVISIQVIQHLSLEKRKKVINNFYNILKEGGTCLVTVYNYYSKKVEKQIIQEGMAFYRFTEEELSDLFYNFNKIKIRGVLHFRGYHHIPKSLLPFFYPIILIDILLSKFKFFNKKSYYLIAITKK